MSLADDIFQEYCQPIFEPVHVFGQKLWVKEMTGRDFGQLQKAVLDFENKNGELRTDQELIKAGVAVVCLYDAEKKERVFPFTDSQSLKAMVNKVANQVPEIALSTIYKVAAPLSALEGDVEDAEKNSGATPVKSGGTESPGN